MESKIIELMAVSFAMLLSSCAMSEDKAGNVGAVLGGIGGVVAGNQIDQKLGPGHKGRLIGGALGAGIGNQVGRNSTSLQGLKKTELE